LSTSSSRFYTVPLELGERRHWHGKTSLPDRRLYEGIHLRVLKLAREGEEILHFLEGPLPEAGSEITGKIDRTKGHQLMRTHAAMHVL
jgi:hypothetical protein